MYLYIYICIHTQHSSIILVRRLGLLEGAPELRGLGARAFAPELTAPVSAAAGPRAFQGLGAPAKRVSSEVSFHFAFVELCRCAYLVFFVLFVEVASLLLCFFACFFASLCLCLLVCLFVCWLACLLACFLFVCLYSCCVCSFGFVCICVNNLVLPRVEVEVRTQQVVSSAAPGQSTVNQMPKP